jgi:hypothetical protein
MRLTEFRRLLKVHRRTQKRSMKRSIGLRRARVLPLAPQNGTAETSEVLAYNSSPRNTAARQVSKL